MRSNKKLILVCLCAVLLAVGSIAGTLAYLTAEETVVNTFTMGKVNITLTEPNVVNGGNEIKVVPGRDVPKDPTVTVLKKSEDAYVRIMLTMTSAGAMQSIVDRPLHNLGGDYANLLYTLEDDGTKSIGFNPNWEFKAMNTENDEITFEFRYIGKVTASADEDTVLPALFDGLKVPGTLLGEELANLGDDFEITVVAHAVQAEGFANADEAWTAFDGQMAALAAENTNP